MIRQVFMFSFMVTESAYSVLNKDWSNLQTYSSQTIMQYKDGGLPRLRITSDQMNKKWFLENGVMAKTCEHYRWNQEKTTNPRQSDLQEGEKKGENSHVLRRKTR